MEPLSILVVDDDAPFRGAVTRVLRAAGHLVDEAGGAGRCKLYVAFGPDVRTC
jgi:CheY-like chemotaxis protein